MSYLKTIVRFVVKNPPGSYHPFTPIRDERPLLSSFMRDAVGAQERPTRPGTFQSVFRPGVDMREISSSDFTALEGQGGASEYFLNNIDLDNYIR